MCLCLYDLTNFYFEGQIVADKEKRCKKGWCGQLPENRFGHPSDSSPKGQKYRSAYFYGPCCVSLKFKQTNPKMRKKAVVPHK